MGEQMTRTDIKSVAAFLLTIVAFITLQNAYPRKIKKGDREGGDREGGAREGGENSAKESTTIQSTEVKADDCSACNDMLKTVKHYDKHVIVYDFRYTLWGKRIEEDSSCFVHTLTEALHNTPGSSAIKIKLTALDARDIVDDCDEGFCTIVIYPDAQIVRFPPSAVNIEKVAKYLVSSDYKLLLDINSCSVTSPSWKRLILVCVHQARDKRCGRAGPQVIQAMRQHIASRGIDSREVTVLPSSHIGGHEYAGTLITYPSGNWYGRITKSNAVELLESVLQDKAYESNLRGCPSW